MAKKAKGERKYYNNPRDDGKVGRNLEVDARIDATPRTTVLHCQGANKKDHTMMVDGKMLTVEYKHNCGTVTKEYSEPIFDDIDLTDKEVLADYILPDVDIVVYGCEIENDYSTKEDLFVFSRNEFIDFLFGYEKTMLRRNLKNGYCLNIQSLNSNRKVKYAVNACLDQMCYGDWLKSIGR